MEASADLCRSLTFGDRKTHEKALGLESAFYVPPEQLDLIFYRLYETEEAARAFRNRLDGVSARMTAG